MNMFGPKIGTWWVKSEKDPRWNKSGRSYGFIFEGGPNTMHAWIDECKNKYEVPPDDLEVGFMKD